MANLNTKKSSKTPKFTETDKIVILNAYLEGHMSIRMIQQNYFRDRSYSEIRKLLKQSHKANSLMRRRRYNCKSVLDSEVYFYYESVKSLRKTASYYHIAPSTVRRHVLRYQDTHQDANILIRERTKTKQ